MSSTQSQRIQELLSADTSPLRDELLRLGFDALSAVPLVELARADALAALVVSSLTRDNALRISQRHVLPALSRVHEGLSARDQKLRAAFSPAAEDALRAVLESGRGPRFDWLRGAFDPDDFRKLLSPVVQKVLVQFATKLPMFNAAQGAAEKGGSIGGLVSLLSKQVQKGAGQIADVGRSVMSGISGEFERRMQAVASDFSQTATSEFRTALIARMKTEEGQRLVQRIRERVLEHTLSAKLSVVSTDLMRLPREEIAGITAEVLDKLSGEVWFRELLEEGVRGVLTELEQKSLAELLAEAGLLEEARAQIVQAVDPGLRGLIRGDAFGDWLERVLKAAETP